MDKITRLGRKLYEAAEAGNTRKAHRLISAGADINVMTVGGCTPLMRAAISGHPGIVRALLDAGADPDVKDCHMYSAVFHALCVGHRECARVLVEACADVNTDFGGRDAPLIWASGYGWIDVILLLIQRGAEVNKRSTRGRTALMHAAWNSPDPEVIAILLRAGADANLKDREGKTALDYAETNEKVKGTDAYHELKKAIL
jgi:ankyrin repeat protein